MFKGVKTFLRCTRNHVRFFLFDAANIINNTHTKYFNNNVYTRTGRAIQNIIYNELELQGPRLAAYQQLLEAHVVLSLRHHENMPV